MHGFFERQGDWGRDMVFHLSRKVAAGLDYAAVSVAIWRVEQLLLEDRALQKAATRIVKMLNV